MIMTFGVRCVGGLRRVLLAGFFLSAALPAGLLAQASLLHQEAYLMPSPEIAALVASNRHENVMLSNLGPDGRHFLNSESEGMPLLAQFAKPYHRLGGIAIDFAANRARGLTTGGTVGMELINWETGARTAIQVPAGARVSGATWSPDGRRVAFLANQDNGTHIWIAEVSNGRSTQLTRTPILATRVTGIDWSGDSRYIYTVLPPEGRGAEPSRPFQPSSPIVRVATSEENRLRTYASLLKDPFDVALFEHYTTGQIARIDVTNRRVQNIGQPAMIESMAISPDGSLLRVRTTRKPFSYIVPASQFGNVEELWDLNGNVLHEFSSRGLQLGAPAAPGGGGGNAANNAANPPRRSLTWRPDGQGMSFLQREPAPAPADSAAGAAPAGNANNRPDRVMQWVAPYDDNSNVVVYSSPNEIRSLQYSADMKWLFLAERVRNEDRVFAVNLDDPSTTFTLQQTAPGDSANAEGTGSLMTTRNALGAAVVRMSSDQQYVFFSGTQTFDDEGLQPRPFVDRVHIRTGERERIFQSRDDVWERISAVLDDDMNRLVLARETATMVPDSWLLDRTTGELRKLTNNVDHHPQITTARRERIMVTRADGFTFKVDVTFPHNYVEGTRLPAMFWFYPREYASQEAYDRTLRGGNPNRFPTVGPSSIEILSAAGYLVVQPDHPIVGPAGRPNDNFVSDMRQNHLAVIDALDERGWADRRRMALGGHSYGGFGTINAMVHTPYFRAGIAGAPNSNRLLTPIGFQSERRSLWEARDVYLEMSPFLYAERLSGALLIYHGEDDQNVGTAPDNSWRMIHVLNGLGKTAAMYMYPFEDHGQSARETRLDMWARWIAWLDHYVKNADVTTPVAPITVVDDAAQGQGQGQGQGLERNR